MDAPFNYQELLGWIPESEMTESQLAHHRTIVRGMPAFSVAPKGRPPVGTKIMLTDLWKHQRAIEAFGRPFRGWGQYSGSCVGVGGGNAAQTSNLVGAILNNEPEKIVLIAWYVNYGLSRQRAGMHGQGEGSFGSTFAASLEGDGALDVRHEGLDDRLPDGSDANEMYVIGKQAELKWSNGGAIPSDIRTAAKKQRFKTSPIKSFEQVRDSILAGRPLTRAGMPLANPGVGQVQHGALVGRYNGRGAHQESWLCYWNHPQLGELIWEQNQWFDVYGRDPGGGPMGGLWIPAQLIDDFCKSQYAEVYSIDDFDGYPDLTEKVFDWSKQSLWS